MCMREGEYVCVYVCDSQNEYEKGEDLSIINHRRALTKYAGADVNHGTREARWLCVLREENLPHREVVLWGQDA